MGAEASEVGRQLQLAIKAESRLGLEVSRKANDVITKVSALLRQEEGWGADDLRA